MMLVLLILASVVKGGSPQTKPHQGPIEFECKFDGNDFCGFTQYPYPTDDFDWALNSGPTSSVRMTGPVRDALGNSHGHYAYINSLGKAAGDKAIMVKDGLSFTGMMCLSFYYHMFGNPVGTLNVFIDRVKVFSRTGSQGFKWLKEEIIIRDPRATEILFEGICKRGDLSDMAIDEVVLRDCTPPQPARFACDFENDVCGFQQSFSDNFNWTKNTGSTRSWKTGPSKDITTGKGFYMYIETSWPRKQGDVARLVSSPLYFKGPMCLTFCYHMYGASMGDLKVFIGNNVVFTKSGDLKDKWFEERINIQYSPGNYQITFEGIRGTNWQSDAAIDDVFLNPGRCPEEVFACNFDNGDCGFKQDTPDDFNWNRNRGYTWSSNTGPSKDHTSGNGHYMYIETSDPRKHGDKAQLVSLPLFITGPSDTYCLIFFYHMYGQTIGTLNVYLGGNRVFSKKGNQGNAWKEALIDIRGYNRAKYPLKFDGIRGTSYTSDIAIDDIYLTKGSCPQTQPPAYSCDFADSFCYQQDTADNLDWTRTNGPPNDRTGGKGYYMSLGTTQGKSGDKALFYSHFLPLMGKMCLEFFYQMNGQGVGTLNIRLRGQTIFTKSGNQGNSWIKEQINLEYATPGFGFKLTIEGIRGGGAGSYIAIDDITLSDGSCSKGLGFICSFDQDECGFTQDTNDNFDWTRRTGPTVTSLTGPSNDHTSGHGYYMYIENPSYQNLHYKARLISPKLFFSSQICLRFFYHMYGNEMGTLRAFLNGQLILYESGDKGNKWLEKRMNVNYMPFYQITFEGERGLGIRSDAAIDDVSLIPGPCA